MIKKAIRYIIRLCKKDKPIKAEITLPEIGDNYCLKIFSGCHPYSLENEDVGVLLVSIPMRIGIKGSLRGNFSGHAIATGKAGHYRTYNDYGKVVLQGEVGISGKDLNMVNTNILRKIVDIVNL